MSRSSRLQRSQAALQGELATNLKHSGSGKGDPLADYLLAVVFTGEALRLNL
jgi:hypothetical protein